MIRSIEVEVEDSSNNDNCYGSLDTATIQQQQQTTKGNYHYCHDIISLLSHIVSMMMNDQNIVPKVF